MTRDETRQKLQNILKLVRTTHWIKHRYRDIQAQDGGDWKICGCLVGLINLECGLLPDEVRGSLCTVSTPFIGAQDNARVLGSSVWGAIKKLHPLTRQTTIEDWQDAAKIQREHIIAVLEQAIADV